MRTNNFVYSLAACFISLATSSCSLFNQPIITDAEQKQIEQRQVQAVETRLDQLKDVSHWQLQGRISIVTSQEAWSGQLWWQQDAQHYLIQFNAPNGQGAMQLSGGDSGVLLKLSSGEIYTAQDADSLVLEQTGWRLPIKHLWFWVRGLPEPTHANNVVLAADGMIESIQQAKWQIEYSRYNAYNSFQFPSKITMKNDDMRVKVIVDRWKIS